MSDLNLNSVTVKKWHLVKIGFFIGIGFLFVDMIASAIGGFILGFLAAYKSMI